MFSIIKIASETLTEHYNPSLFNYFYETFPHGLWVAEKLHKIVGFIVVAKTGCETARILMLAISEKNRRQGIGSALLKNVLKEISTINIKHVELEVRKNNTRAIRFYQNHSFQVINVVAKFYQNGEDAYIMRLII